MTEEKLYLDPDGEPLGHGPNDMFHFMRDTSVENTFAAATIERGRVTGWAGPMPAVRLVENEPHDFDFIDARPDDLGPWEIVTYLQRREIEDALEEEVF